MRAWLLELMVGLRRRGEELVDHLEELVVEGCGEMAAHNNIQKFCRDVVGKMDDRGMKERLADRTSGPKGGGGGVGEGGEASPAARHPALFS